MATLIARIDNYDPAWGTLEKVKNENLREWMMNNCKLETPEEVDLDEVFDDIVSDGVGFRITYGDWGIIEELKLIEFNENEL